VSRSFVASSVAKQSDEIPNLLYQQISPFASFCLKEKGLAILEMKLMIIVFNTQPIQPNVKFNQ
jgi:hypothetical protein